MWKRAASSIAKRATKREGRPRLRLLLMVVFSLAGVTAQALCSQAASPAPPAGGGHGLQAQVRQRFRGGAVLQGIAVDEDGVPVAGVEIRVEELNVSTVTAADGTFRISRLPPGTFTVTAASEEYFSEKANQVQLSGGQAVELEIHLTRQVPVEETVVVTGTGTEYLAQEAPIRTELITTKEVDRQVKTTVAEALTASIPGVRVEMDCQNCGFTQLRLNGLKGPYTQILEDGLPSYSGVAAVYGLEQIPTEFIQQIEVVKGGNSALYGPGAVAGVVNLIRREPQENRFRVDLLGGWHRGRPEQQVGGSAQLVTLPGGFSADFYYRGINRVPIDRDGDGFSDIGKRRLNAGGFGLYRSFLDGRARLSVNGTIADEFRRGGDRFDRPPDQTWITEQVVFRRSTGSIRWNHTVTPNTYYSLKASLAYLYRDTYYGSGFDPNAYGSTRNPLWVSDGQLGHQTGAHTILGGYQFRRDYVDDRAPAYNRRYGGIFSDHGLYLQDEWEAGQRFTVLAGLRADRSNQLKKWVLSPRAGLKYGLTKSLSWRASLSTGFRAPEVFNEDLHITQVGGEGLLIQNSPELTEEKSVSFASGLDYVGAVAGRSFQLGASFFWTDLRDNFQLKEVAVVQGNYRQLLRVNGKGSYVRGVDLNGNLKLTSKLSFRGGASFQVARYKDPEEQFGSLSYFRTPERYGFLGFDWELPWKIQLFETTEFTGSMLVPHYAGYIPADRLETSSDFTVFNLVLSRTFDVADNSRARVFVNINNITDDYQPDLDQGPDRDAGYVYGPMQMRRIVMGITWEF